MEAIGQFRSYNRHEGAKPPDVIGVCTEIHFMDEFTDYTKTNQIFLDGYICEGAYLSKKRLWGVRSQICCWR